MTAPLTALERDLLACVERLVTACETSAAELSGLEARSTKRLQVQFGWYRGLRDVAHTLADRVNAGVAWLAERRGYLQRAGREVERELELSEGRRREAETELEVQDRDMDRGLTH